MLTSDLRRWPLISHFHTHKCLQFHTHVKQQNPWCRNFLQLKRCMKMVQTVQQSAFWSVWMGSSESKLSDQNTRLSTLTYVLPKQRQSLESSQSVTSRFRGEWPRKTPRFLGPPHVCSCVFACTCIHTNMPTHVHIIHTEFKEIARK